MHGLKAIGYVQIFPYVFTPRTKRRLPDEQPQLASKSSSGTNACMAIAFAGLALAAAFGLPYFYNRP